MNACCWRCACGSVTVWFKDVGTGDDASVRPNFWSPFKHNIQQKGSQWKFQKPGCFNKKLFQYKPFCFKLIQCTFDVDWVSYWAIKARAHLQEFSWTAGSGVKLIPRTEIFVWRCRNVLHRMHHNTLKWAWFWSERLHWINFDLYQNNLAPIHKMIFKSPSPFLSKNILFHTSISTGEMYKNTASS